MKSMLGIDSLIISSLNKRDEITYMNSSSEAKQKTGLSSTSIFNDCAFSLMLINFILEMFSV